MSETSADNRDSNSVVLKDEKKRNLLNLDYEVKLKKILQKFMDVDASQLLQSICLRNDNAGEVLSELDKINEPQLNRALLIQDKIINQIIEYQSGVDVNEIKDEIENNELDDVINDLQSKDSLDFQKLLNLVIFFLRDKHIGDIKKLISNVGMEQYDLQVLARIGEFTGLIAHVVRNPLANILITAELLGAKLEPDDPCHAHVNTIINEIEKLSTKIEDLVNYKDVRDDNNEMRMEELDIHGILNINIADLRSKFDDFGIKITRSFSKSVPKIHMLALNIEEAFLNILQNMVDVMPGGGVISIVTRKVKGLYNGNGGVVIKIEDTGGGIPSEHIAHIFDQRYTTKEKGMGLGLYMAKKFINNHNGSIKVENRAETGARFTVVLPINPVDNKQDS